MLSYEKFFGVRMLAPLWLKWMIGESTFLCPYLKYKTCLGEAERIQDNFVSLRIVTFREMEASMKFIFVLGLVLVFTISGLEKVDGATSPCGKSSPDSEAMKLAPCAEAAQDEKADVSNSCCLQVKSIGQNPSCLCAVMLSNTAKSSGIKPEVAITIPKRCNIANRPVGYKCGRKFHFIFMSLHFHVIFFLPFFFAIHLLIT